MSENSILAGIFRMGDQVKRNLRDFAGNPGDYLDNVAHQNNIEWKKDPVERSMGFFNPVPLGTMTPFMLRKQIEDVATNMSRRDFMKKSAGIAGGTAAASIPGAKLLQKFAPEERAAVKQAAVETAPKYKYNSLKEYLDDVETSAMSKFDDPRSAGWDVSTKDLMKERLLQDELAYKTAKDNLTRPNPKKDFNTGLPPQSQVDLLESFSPQAKEEMKLLKDKSISLDRSYGGTEPEAQVWTDWLINSKGDVDSTLKALQELK